MTRAAESTHWYTGTGEPAYTVKARDGTDRPTTLRDARKLNLYPSVTTIIRCASAPALERWKREQTLMAALTLPRRSGELESDWLRRVETDSGEQARKAADRGTAIHAAIQGHFEGKPPDPDYWPHVCAARDSLKETYGSVTWVVERSFAHSLGFGGKSDLHGESIVVDVKSKEFTEDRLPLVYDEHAMQLAAYGEGIGVPPGPRAILYVSVSVPGLAHMVELTPAHIASGWSMFCGLLSYWQAKNDYRPNRQREAA